MAGENGVGGLMGIIIHSFNSFISGGHHVGLDIIILWRFSLLWFMADSGAFGVVIYQIRLKAAS